METPPTNLGPADPGKPTKGYELLKDDRTSSKSDPEAVRGCHEPIGSLLNRTKRAMASLAPQLLTQRLSMDRKRLSHIATDINGKGLRFTDES